MDVTLTICGWSGTTVNDAVLEARYQTSVTTDGGVEAEFSNLPVAPGECTNSELVSSAFDAIAAYDKFWGAALLDPPSFNEAVAAEYATEDYVSLLSSEVEKWIEDDVVILGSAHDPENPRVLVTDVLWRRRSETRIELVLCENQDPTFGIYRDGVLIDDVRSPDSPGLHQITLVALERTPQSTTGWLVGNTAALGWSDCSFPDVDDYLQAVENWRADGGPFGVLEQSG